MEYTEVIVPVSTTPDKVDYQVRWSDHIGTSPWSVYESGTPFSITNGAYGVDTTITLEVRAVRGSQVDATPATCSWTLLTIESAGAPDTIITDSFPEDGGTIGTDSQAHFFFDSDDSSVFAFECRLITQFNDRPNIVPDFNTCSGNGEQRYSNLPAGQYTFEVRAVNPEGIPDPIPARVSFTVQ